MTKRAEYQTMQIVDSSTFNGSYQFITTFSAPTIAYKVWNDSNVGVTISTDGVNPHDFAPSTGGYVWDVRTNHGREQQLAFPYGTSIYFKASAGTGNVYLMALNEGQE